MNDQLNPGASLERSEEGYLKIPEGMILVASTESGPDDVWDCDDVKKAGLENVYAIDGKLNRLFVFKSVRANESLLPGAVTRMLKDTKVTGWRLTIDKSTGEIKPVGNRLSTLKINHDQIHPVTLELDPEAGIKGWAKIFRHIPIPWVRGMILNALSKIKD